MTKVVVKNGNVDGALKMFNKQVARSGTLSAVKDKKFYEKPGVKNRKKKEQGIKNSKKRDRYNKN